MYLACIFVSKVGVKMANIDIEQVKSGVDLLDVASRYSVLKRKASTAGGEYAGACPVCGGVNRFVVQPLNRIWLCRQCHPKWGDVIELVQYVDGVGFLDACERLGYRKSNGKKQQSALQRVKTAPKPPAPPQKPPYLPPDDIWQAKALDLVKKYEQRLWSANGERARLWLNKRGLKDGTIEHFRLGLQYRRDGSNAISIPCFVDGVLWYVKYRVAVKAGSSAPKYTGEHGNRTQALFNADSIRPNEPALLVEGEFDTMLAWQEFNDIMPCFTVGSATNKINLTAWGLHLIKPRYTLILPDNDSAGWSTVEDTCNVVKEPRLTALNSNDKDLTDYFMAGNSARAWAVALLEWHAGLDEYYKRS